MDTELFKELIESIEQAGKIRRATMSHVNVKRYDPIQYHDIGGSSLGQMEEVTDGDYVSFEDYEELRRDFMKLHEQSINDSWELTMIKNPFQN